jgi:hypothetical protein
MLDLGFVSYGLAATSFLILTLLLLTSWQGRAQGARLVVACAVTAAWAALLAFGSSRMDLSLPMVMLAESLRYGAWFIVLTGLMRSAGLAGGLSRAVHVTWIGGVALAFGLPVLVGAGVPIPSPMLLIIGAAC